MCLCMKQTKEEVTNERNNTWPVCTVCQNMKQQEYRDDRLSVIRVATVDGAVVNRLISLISRWPPVQPDGGLD